MNSSHKTKSSNESIEEQQTKQTKQTENGEENLIILDWDDTLMMTNYLLLNIDYNKFKKTSKLSINGNNALQKEFISNLKQTGHVIFNLLSSILIKFKSSNIKIITNGKKGWLFESLYISSKINGCDIYKKINNLLISNEIQVIYARNLNLNYIYWKTVCFDVVLSKYFDPNIHVKSDNKQSYTKLNIITCGDNWFDHKSLKSSLLYQTYKKYINHHQIKLASNCTDCSYFMAQLKYIRYLIDQHIILRASNPLILEFDGM